MNNFYAFCITFFFIGIGNISAQNGGIIRGNVFEKETGNPVIFGTVVLEGTTIGTNTDENGFFSIGNVPPGDYNLVASYIGLDSASVNISLKDNQIITRNLYLVESAFDLGVVSISARKEKAKSEVQVSKITVTQKQIKALPSTGGQADIAQYLPVLPGIISTGDQGGQIYIRGGSPVQNKILLDGMTIYNPFHSIGFFSVFETEIIRSVDVLTGGFSAEYGGRVSAVVDIKTREGNKKRFGGLVAANPFQGTVLVEGPLKKYEEGGGSASFILTGKHAYIQESSKQLYKHALVNDTLGLPYGFTDLYGKVSFLSDNGSRLDAFGFNFTDKVDFEGVANLDWNNFGGGANFKLIPPNANLVMGGTVSFSNYEITLDEGDGEERVSSLNTYGAELNFTNFGLNNETQYGFDFTSVNTNFRFRNFLGVTLNNESNTTEIAAFLKFKQKIGGLIIEPSFRAQYYAAQRKFSPEPRLGIKYNVNDDLRFKLAGGYFSQNILSSVSEEDIVNFFVGFLTGPEERIKKQNTDEDLPHNLQTAWHGIFGVEVDLTDNLELNVEPYAKIFNQIIQLNRNKLLTTDEDFTSETGEAYGIDVSLRYETRNIYLWGTYSLGHVKRDDGEQVYPTIFDRRHNVNLLGTYAFGKDQSWEAAARWNFGSGFPFTLTQGFYEGFNFFEDGITSDYTTEQGELEIVYDEKRNGGRLSAYHRLDLSLKKTIEFSKYTNLEVTASITNAYDRDNIFFVDRITTEKVFQLPILPSMGIVLRF